MLLMCVLECDDDLSGDYFLFQGWRDRYFRLKDGKLHYYKSEKVHVHVHTRS